MKILETQNAILSNYEVYQHIVDTHKRNKANKRRVPGNLAMLMTEVSNMAAAPRSGWEANRQQVICYLRTEPSPLAKQEETGAYNPAVFARLLDRLGEE